MVYAGRVLILTTFDLDEYVYAAPRAGASGFLLKDTPPAGLLAAIRVIAGQTTKTYVGRILAKLNLRDRAQAVVVAYETGLVQPGSRGGESRPVRYLDLFFRTDRGVTAPSQAQLRRGWPRRA